MLVYLNEWHMGTLNHIEDLKKCNEKYHAIFLDDFSFKGLDRDQLLTLVENIQERTKRILFDAVPKKNHHHHTFEPNDYICPSTQRLYMPFLR